MSIYDLRSKFPLLEREFGSPSGIWIARLAEVSDLRPDADRLSWYLAFERRKRREDHDAPTIRKLEIVTSADHLLQTGFPSDLESRIESWILSDEEDGRVEWLDY